MNPENNANPISVGFISESSGGSVTSVEDLVRVLNAFQRGVYTTAGIDHQNLQLTPAQRKRYQLGIVDIHHSDLWVELLPIAVITIMQQTSLFPNDVVSGLYVNAIWSVFTNTIDSMRDLFQGKRMEERREAAYIKAYTPIAKAAIEHDQTIKMNHISPNGETHTFETTQASSRAILQRAGKFYGELREFSQCTLRNIMTASSAISVKFPEYPRRLLRCEYHRSQESDIVNNLKAYDLITIVGRPIYGSDDDIASFPRKVYIDHIKNSDGRIIVNPIGLG